MTPTPTPRPPADRVVVPQYDLRAQYDAIRPEIDCAIQGVVEGGLFERGAPVQALEEAFARFVGAQYAVSCGSGYAAIFLALKATGLGPGDEVITVADTENATVAAISHTGARPVFVDVDPRTFNMDPALIEAAITPRTKALLPVDLYGLPCDMDAIMEVAARRRLTVVDDATLAVGATLRGRPVGALCPLTA
ncbi:MAG: erythromycin biosynthesis sensory transduction protein eryC1, partial [Chloroflexi bacterium]|nr:erythromycin biosynthesis sensory transduction protein eryC1 [Chloroflexota bacterium]